MKANELLSNGRLRSCGVALCTALLALAACRSSSEAPQPFVIAGETMGTHYSVKMPARPHDIDQQALGKEIDAALSRIDALMSTYRPDSELSQLNQSGGNEWFAVSRETASVIDEAVQIGQLSGDAFDVTVGPLVNLWSFGPEKNVAAVPSDDAIRRCRDRIGLRHVEVRRSPPAVRKGHKDLYIDLSGIAKGFAVDRIAELLERHGMENYLIDVGGDLRAKGHNHRGEPWQVAVESPLAETRAIQQVVAVENLAMATSGDYRNYFEENSVRYCHIIDPRSGRPVAHTLASVTVLAASCARADALATALMVLGPDAGYDLAVREELPALFIIKSDTGFVEKSTPSFAAHVQH